MDTSSVFTTPKVPLSQKVKAFPNIKLFLLLVKRFCNLCGEYSVFEDSLIAQ